MLILSKNLQKNVVKNDIEKSHTRPFKCDHCLCHKCYYGNGTMDINKVVDNLGDDPDGGLEEEQVGANRMKDKYELYSLVNWGKVMITMQLYNSLFDYSINKLLAQ